nr:MAG TPA: hypothetical protein [Caudoviricetes sp.]
MQQYRPADLCLRPTFRSCSCLWSSHRHTLQRTL